MFKQQTFFCSSQTYDKCFLGSSETADANRVFCGQMGAVYLFSEALSAAQILAIYQLGPGYKVPFHTCKRDSFLCSEARFVLDLPSAVLITQLLTEIHQATMSFAFISASLLYSNTSVHKSQDHEHMIKWSNVYSSLNALQVALDKHFQNTWIV